MIQALLLFLCLLLAPYSHAQAAKATLAQEDVGICNPLRFSTTRTSATLTTAINSTGSTLLPDCRNTKILLIPPGGTWTITSDLNVPARMTVRIPAGASITINSGITLTLNAVPDCDKPYECISSPSTGVLAFGATMPSTGLSSFISSGCTPTVPSPASLTFDAFACSGTIHVSGVWPVFIEQAAAAVGPLNGGNGTYWLAVHRDTSTAVGGWTRQTSTHYLWQLAASQPANPTGGLVVRRITVTAGAITVSRPRCVYAPTQVLDTSVDVRRCGVVMNGSTDNTQALLAAEELLHDNGATDVGGTLMIPEGIMVISSWTPTKNGLQIKGMGHFATTIRCTDAAGAGDDCILLQNISRHHWSDLTIDGNGDKTSTLRFLAQVGNSNAEHLFTNVRFIGATTNTINFDDAGGGSPNDISQNTFVSCYVRSAAPSNAQVRNNAANAVSIRFLGGQISAPGAGSPFNIDLQKGQITLFDAFLAGATSFDVNAASGQFQSYGGRTESAGGYFHSLSTDPSNDGRSAVHVIQGLQGSNVSATSVSHEARRVLRLDSNYWNGNVRIGQAGGAGNNAATVIANANTFAATRGFVYEANTNGRMFVGYEDPSSTTLADLRARDVQIRLMSFQAIPTFANADTTPDVSAGNVFQTGNAGATSITFLDGGSIGQIVTIICQDANTTFVDNGGTFNLAGNFVCTTNDVLQLVFDSVSWREMSRSVN